jgi:hypothetical protein
MLDCAGNGRWRGQNWAQNWALDQTKSSPWPRLLAACSNVRPMRRAKTAIFVLVSTVAFAGEPSLLTSISGLWQFAELNVWIQIDDKGAAYQCRIGREGTVFSASGHFVSPNSIEWQNIWGNETVILMSGELILKGRFGEFKHHRASTPMSPACLPLRQRGGVTT